MSLIPLLARRRHCKLSLTSLLPTPFFTHGRTDGWSNSASPTTTPYPYIVYLAVKIFFTLLNITSLQSPNPILQCLNILIVSEFQNFASSPPLCKSFYLAFKIFIIITMFCTPLSCPLLSYPSIHL